MRVFGADEIQPGVAALGRLRAYLADRGDRGPTVFVRSEYRVGQFTNGDVNHPLANLCVPGRNVDCEWANSLVVSPHQIVVTKHEADAGESATFRSVIDEVVRAGTQRIVMVGFQLTTCVQASALSTQRMVRDRGARVTVIEALTGVRASSLLPPGLSRVEATIRQLESYGVAIVRPGEHEQAENLVTTQIR